MSRLDPIQYAERLYSAIRAANFSPMSFLAFGNAVKEGVAMRSMPRIAAEPFMRIVGEMLDMEEEASSQPILDAETIVQEEPAISAVVAASAVSCKSDRSETESESAGPPPIEAAGSSKVGRRGNREKA